MADKITIEIELDNKKALKGVKTFKKLSKKEAMDAGEGIGREISSGIRRAVSGVGATLIAALGLRKIIDLNREFGKSLAEINTIAGDLGKTQAELRNQLILTSTQFGTSASEQARSFYQIISAGITDASAANEVLIQSNKLAIGGLTSIEGAVDLLTSTINAFGKDTLSAERAADILFGTVRLGKTRIDELQGSLGLILPTAKALKIDIEDVTGAIAQLTTKGISTSEAITQINAVFTALLKNQEAAKKLGPDVAKAFTLQALQAKGLAVFLRDLNVATQGSEETLTKLLGRAEGAKAILALAGDNFEGLADKVNQLKNSTGAADAAFNIMTQTLDFRLNQVTSKFSGIVLTLSGDTGTLSKALDVLNGELDDVLNGLNIFGGIDLLIGAALTRLVIKLKETQIQFINFRDSIPLIGTVTKAVSELTGNTVEKLKREIQELEQSIINVGNFKPAEAAAEGFKELATVATETKKTIVKVSKDIGAAVATNIVASVSQGLQAVGAALAGGANGFDNFGKVVLGILGDFAIRIGSLLISIGLGIGALSVYLATFNPIGVLAAGAALVVLGGLLKGLSGGITAAPVGGGGITAPAAGGGIQIDPTGGTDLTSIEEELEDAGPRTEVNLIIQGNVLDRRETGLEIAEVLKEVFQTNDISVGGLTA